MHRWRFMSLMVCGCVYDDEEAFDEPLDQHQGSSTRATRLNQSRNFLDHLLDHIRNRSTPFVLLDWSSGVQRCPLFCLRDKLYGTVLLWAFAQSFVHDFSINRSPYTHSHEDSTLSQTKNPSLSLFFFSKCNIHIIQAS